MPPNKPSSPPTTVGANGFRTTAAYLRFRRKIIYQRKIPKYPAGKQTDKHTQIKTQSRLRARERALSPTNNTHRDMFGVNFYDSKIKKNKMTFPPLLPAFDSQPTEREREPNII